MKTLFPRHLEVSAAVMDLQLERQNLVSSNIANLNTPGYQPRRIEFEKELQAALDLDDTHRLARTRTGHAPSPFRPGEIGSVLRELHPRVVPGTDGVNLDTEMALMTKNALSYNTLATVLQKGYAGIQKIIQEGGK